MARGGDVPKLGGYDYEFISTVPEDWQCPVCRLILKDPVQIVGCGHRLCTICMESLMSCPSPTCPVDRQPLASWKIFQDAGCHRQILDLTVKCSHSRCSWTGELRAMEKHQSECLFKMVKCSNSGCTKMLSKRDMKIHETLECTWRKVDCEYCQGSVIMNQRQKHFDICPKFPVLCTNKCGARDIPREKLEVHVRDECPATEVQCEFKILGCEAVFPRADAKSHSQTHIESHLIFALRGLEATKHQVHELVTKVNDQSQQIKRQSQQIERQSGQIERLISKDKEQSEKVERLTSSLQDQPPQRERHGPIKQTFPTPFEWKIPNVESVLLKEDSLVSDPFYLDSIGYKYLLKFEISQPFAADFAKMGSCYDWALSEQWLYVNIKVIPGKFDRSLSWPCKEKLRVTLADQDSETLKITEVIDFDKGKKSCSRSALDDYHDYRKVIAKKVHLCRPGSNWNNITILIRVNRE